MSVIKCLKCGKAISEGALRCIYCSAAVSEEIPSLDFKTLCFPPLEYKPHYDESRVIGRENFVKSQMSR